MSSKMSRWFLAIVTLITTCMVNHAIAEPKHGGTLSFLATAGVPRHFNPAVISGSATAMVGTQIFASPLRYDENWNPLPYLAESWQTSKDGLSVTLKLVKGATFHDGHTITSEDVAFSIMTVKKYHPFKSMFASVERVDTPDPQTVVIRLARPHPAILLAMTPLNCSHTNFLLWYLNMINNYFWEIQ
jgi:peptide/nickel transport system substrate-binding protein